jgi:TolB-like protein
MSRTSATLALLPFEVLSGTEEDARLARGFLHDLLSELSRFPSLGVIASDSVRAALGEGAEGATLAGRLGARYFLKGSLRRWPKQLRINAQLVEAETGHHVWAGRYEGADLPSVNDEIAAKVANALAAQVDQSLLAGARRRPPASLQAYECWLRGMECLQRGTRESDEEGRRFFEQALESDPHYARALGGLSLSYFNEWSCQAWEQFEEREKLAYEHAVRAEALDPHDAVVQLILARIEQYRRQFDRAAPRLDRARRLAPNDANILVQLGSCLAMDGDATLGWDLARQALELNPLPPGWVYCYAALPLFVLRRYRESLALSAQAPPQLVVDVPAYEAAASAYLGDQEGATRFLGEFREDFRRRIACGREPVSGELLRWVLHVNPYRREEDVAHLEEGLRKAGLEGSPRHVAPTVNWPVANAFRQEGALWTLAYNHQVVQMPGLRGFQDLARLLAQPGVEIHAAELAGQTVRSEGMDLLDDQARRAYRARLVELEDEIGAASQAGDVGRVERLEEERERLITELGRASGLGARARKAGGSDERARTAVTWRIRNAIKRIETAHPALARHLIHSIQTGAFCRYQPERPTTWSI